MKLDRVRLWNQGASGAAADPAASDPTPSNREPDPETAEQKNARLEAELKVREDALKQERDLRLQHEQKARDLRNELDSRRDPTPPATGDPLDQLVEDLEAQMAHLREQKLKDPSVALALMNAKEKRDARDNAIAREARQAELHRQFEAIKADPERKAYHARAIELFNARLAPTPDAAVEQAQAEGKNKSELEALRKEKEELQRDLEAARSQKVSAGSAPVFSIDKAPPNPEGKVRVKESDWQKLDQQPARVQHEWNAAYKTGRLEIIHGQ